MRSIHYYFQKLLGGLAGVIFRHPWKILLASVLLTFLSLGVAAARFKVVNNIAQLLDDKSDANRHYLALQKEFGTDEFYLVLIRSDDPEKNREVALKVGDSLRMLTPFISRVYCKLDFSKLQDRFLLLTPKEELLDIEKKITLNLEGLEKTSVDFNLNSILDEANRSFDDKRLRKKEGWQEFKPFIERFEEVLNQVADQIEKKKIPKGSRHKTDTLDTNLPKGLEGKDINTILEERRFISFDEGRAILVIGVRGAIEENSASPSARTTAAIRAHLKEISAQYPDVTLGLTGEPVLNDDELQTSTRDTEKASFITLALISALFFLSYRSLERPAWAGLVLGMGVAWTFAFTMLAIGHFNIISFAVIPMVLGLGIDFGIQVLGRYEEELGDGHDVRKAMHTALSITGVAVLTGGSTTAAAFFTLCFNEFLGLRELGAIAGASMVLCLIANLVTLPAIFFLRDRRRSSEVLRRQATNSWGFMAPLDHRLVRFPKTALTVSALVTVLSIYGIFHVRFDYNLLHLQNQKLESVKVLHEIFDVSENSSLFASVVVHDLAEARRVEKQLLTLPSVAKVESITGLLPEDQELKLPIIRRIHAALNNVKLDTNVADKVDVVRARRDIEQFLAACHQAVSQAKKYQKVSKQAREAVVIFNGLIPPLERMQKTMDGMTQEEVGRRLNQSQIRVFGAMKKKLAWLKTQKADRPIVPADLPEDITARFVSPSGKVLLQVYSKGDIWEREPNRRFVTELRTVAPNVTGTPVQNFEYTELLRVSFVHAAVWAFAVIVILIILHFRTPKLVALAIFPLVLAVIWRTGLMGGWDLPFNPANVVTLPLIIGIDVAYGVYIVDRFREDGHITIFSTSTGKAIIMTGLTALFGFLSLLVSRYEGMYSIGLLMTLGIGIGMITTILVLPQVLALITKPPSSTTGATDTSPRGQPSTD